jgi:hypothetical protein
MTLREAIEMSRVHKRKIRNDELAMEQQSAKSLIHWLFTDEDEIGKEIDVINKFLKSNAWELEGSDEQFHVYYVEDSSPKLKSFSNKENRQKFINKFIEKYGSMDDGDGNWIEMQIDGSVSLTRKVNFK